MTINGNGGAIDSTVRDRVMQQIEAFEQALDDGHCIVGSPVRVRDEIGKQANEAGVTYIMKRCHHAFLRIHG